MTIQKWAQVATAALAVAAIGMLTGCGSSRPDYSAYTFPPPPDTARIRLVDVFYGSEDVNKSWALAVAGKMSMEGFHEPSGVAFDTSGNIVVVDLTLGLVVVDRQTHKLHIYKDGTMRTPVGVAVDRENNFYIADPRAKAVFLYSSFGEFRRLFGRPELYDNPTGVAVDAKRQRVYVSDSHKHVVFVLSMAGDSIGVIGTRGDSVTQFNYPTQVSVDTAGNLYVVDAMNFRIQVFSPEGQFLRAFGKAGDGAGTFARPRGVAVDRDGNIYVTDAIFNNFQVFDSKGHLRTFIGRTGARPAQFSLPGGIACDGRYIAITDQVNHRVQLFEYLGEPKK